MKNKNMKDKKKNKRMKNKKKKNHELNVCLHKTNTFLAQNNCDIITLEKSFEGHKNNLICLSKNKQDQIRTHKGF